MFHKKMYVDVIEYVLSVLSDVSSHSLRKFAIVFKVF